MQTGGPKTSLNTLMMAAGVRPLPAHPTLNAELVERDILLYDTVIDEIGLLTNHGVLLYSSGQENMPPTIAGGKLPMRDRVVQVADEADALRRCRQAALKLANRSGSNRKVNRRWRTRERE